MDLFDNSRPGLEAGCSACGFAVLDGSKDGDADSCPRCGDDANRTWALESAETADSALIALDLGREVEATLSDILARNPSDSGSGRQGDSSAPLGLNRAERYEVLGTLGRGAMGLVLKVRDTALDEILALKILDPEVGVSELVIERFKQEVRIARRIHHPNVARIHDLFQWHHHLAISQEYIGGRDLAEVMELGPLAPEPITRYMRHICSALQAAHDIGVVHRDLKPSNIRLDEDDRPRILDFGLAALSDNIPSESNEWLLGTPTHMAPEQARAPHQVDQRADIYSLGVILFRMATGCLPFPQTSPREVIQAHLHAPVPRPRALRSDIPPAVEHVILRCLKKNPADRYGSAKAVYEELRRAFGKGLSVVHEAPERGPSQGTVLLVDDNDPMRAAVRTHLEELNVTAVEATNGFEAIELAMRERPDLILLDVIMPVLDGREALRILKSTSSTAVIPVVVMSGVDDVEEEALLHEMGAAMVLGKPLKRAILELLIGRFIVPKEVEALV